MTSPAEPGGIILISGPPGAGKSTVARELAASSTVPTAYIEGDTFWHFIVKGAAAAKQPKLRKKNSRIVIKAMMLAALPYARGGYEAIVDFSIGPWALDLFQAWLKETPFDYVILCPSEAVCAQRAASRTEGAMPDYTPYRELHAAFSALGPFERHALRHDEAGPTTLAARIRAGVAAGAYRVG
jgi:predicted kinase